MWREYGQIVNDIKSRRQHYSYRTQKWSTYYNVKLYESDTISDYCCQYYQESHEQIKGIIAFLPIIFLWHMQNKGFIINSDISSLSPAPICKTIILNYSGSQVRFLGLEETLEKASLSYPSVWTGKEICLPKEKTESSSLWSSQLIHVEGITGIRKSPFCSFCSKHLFRQYQ